jgi:hypothetical protein
MWASVLVIDNIFSEVEGDDNLLRYIQQTAPTQTRVFNNLLKLTWQNVMKRNELNETKTNEAKWSEMERNTMKLACNIC